MGKTLYDKIWAQHIVDSDESGDLIYIDRHLIHEVTSPQAFDGIRINNRTVRCPQKTLAVADHNTPTKDISVINDEDSRLQLELLGKNTKEFGIQYFPIGHPNNGIVHVVGPDLGFVLPGQTIVCGDSHTATHGAFGSIAFGIGTSQVEHVLVTQTLRLKKAKNMKIAVNGSLKQDVTAKDIILYIIGQIGTAGGTGYAIEFCGDTINGLSMEGRMTICNMAIEAGARFGLIEPDQVTFDYVREKQFAPKNDKWNSKVQEWSCLQSDINAQFDRIITFDASKIDQQITWGTSPEDVMSINDRIPEPADKTKQRALEYMGVQAGMKLSDLRFDKVFIGSCTNARIEDLRAVANIVKDKKVLPHIDAIIVPGSGVVKMLAEREGLDKIFIDAGFEWRNPGCSMCLAMNEDKLAPYERCASTSNRNFEGRQGHLGRTHLVSPITAAMIAVGSKI